MGPGFGYCPICGGAGCASCWVFITPWCGIGFSNMVGGGCCKYCCGACLGVGDTGGRGAFMDSFIHFEVRNLGEMVSIMSIITAKNSREVRTEVVVVIPLEFVVIVPLGVMVTLILVSPSKSILLGVISTWSSVIIVSFFFLYSTDGMDFPYSTVQKYEAIEWERVEHI
jgi:hypothetical protein